MEHRYSKDYEIFYCEVCSLYEGGLTTDCSGEMSSHVSEEVYNGELDYRSEEGWVEKLNPTNQSWVASAILNTKKGNSKTSRSKDEIMSRFPVSEEEYYAIEKKVDEYLSE